MNVKPTVRSRYPFGQIGRERGKRWLNSRLVREALLFAAADPRPGRFDYWLRDNKAVRKIYYDYRYGKLPKDTLLEPTNTAWPFRAFSREPNLTRTHIYRKSHNYYINRTHFIFMDEHAPSDYRDSRYLGE